VGDYKFYFLTAANKILRREDVACADDAAAVALGYERDHAHAIEIWQGKRVVATVLPGQRAPD
jgi:hypothetical protein